MFFSIIIPNYNSFHLMDKCIESLKAQTYKNFEVIVVDDCSTDDSYEQLCRFAAETELDFKVFKQEKNAGPGAARNRGIDESRGDYITFVDADDYMLSDLFEKLLPYAQMGYDSILFDAVEVRDDGQAVLRILEKTDVKYGEIDNKEAFVYARGGTFGKAYRSAHIKGKNIRFGEYYRSEDIPFTKSALALSERLYYLNEAFYHYVQVSTSLVHSDAGKWDEQNSINTEKIIKENIKELDLSLEYEAYAWRTIYPYRAFAMIYKGVPSKDIKKYISDNINKNTKKNPYLKAFPKSRYTLMRIVMSKNMLLIKALYKYLYK